MNVAIIGCGLIGQKRASVLGERRLGMDVSENMARCVTGICSCRETCVDWRKAVTHDDVDLVIVVTTNDFLAPVSLAAIKHGKHVLMGKPAARHGEELRLLLEDSKRAGAKVRVGCNLRYQPSFRKAREIVDSGVLCPLMFARGRYGHYDREWRAKPGIAGGELLG